MKTVVAKNTWFTDSDLRLDASYHLSDSLMIMHQYLKSPYPFLTISNASNDIFSGNIFKRVYVTNPEKGIPYLTGSDMIKSEINSSKYLSKKQVNGLQKLMLKKGWILVSCSGTLGNTAFTNELFENRVGTHDLIRIIPKNKEIKSGFLFAYLASKYGYALLTQSSYGGVIKHIEPEHIANIPVPIFPSEKQKAIHNLVSQSAELRVEASMLLEEAIKLFENKMPEINSKKIFKLSVKSLQENNLRLEGTTNYTNIRDFYIALEKQYTLSTIDDLSENVFTPGIFKRVRVNNSLSGIPFLSGSDLLDARPSFNSFLSKRMKNIDDYILKEGWIAIQDAGTIGYVSLINGYLDGVSATNNLIRIIPKESPNYNPYIFTFLKTKQGQTILKSYEYGSVQKHIDNNQLKSIKIPILPDFELITKNVSNYRKKVTEACLKEIHAIQLIETEIAQWQQ